MWMNFGKQLQITIFSIQYIYYYNMNSITFSICDRILENGSKSHIFISLYLLLLHEQYYIFHIISYHYMEFNAQIIKTVK